MTTLGIDLGTSSIKAAVLDDDGRILGQASHPYRVKSAHPGHAEGDPREWLQAAREVVTSVTYGQGSALSAVGICGQMHGLVVTDKHLKPLRPAILWADARAVTEARELGSQLSRTELSALGSPAVTGFAATTIAWLTRHEPEVMAKAAHLLQPKDWLRAVLGGGVATDPSDASGTLLYDVVSGSWSARVLDLLDLDPALLPEIRSSIDHVGELELSGRLRVAAVVGAADTASAIVGLGLKPGQAYVAIGTGAQVVGVLDGPVLDESLRTHTFATAGPAGSGWYRLGAIQSAGLVLSTVLKWFDATPEEAAKALHRGVIADDPIFVPALSGERTPFMDPRLRGSWHGLSLTTDRSAMLRSVLEAVAQSVALGVDAVRESGVDLSDPVPLIGGGSHAPEFRQLLADATGLSLAIADTADSAVVGAAVLASGRTSNDALAIGPESITPSASAAALLRSRRERMAGYAVEADADPVEEQS